MSKHDADNRAEKNINTHFDITQRWEYYIRKFVPYYAENRAFARFLSIRVAANLLYGDYYFGNKHDRKCSDVAAKSLSYKDIPYKYSLIFRTPRPIGWCVYQLTLLKKRIFNKK